MKDLNEVLMWASEYGELNTVKYCLDNGADVHAEDDEALCCASDNGHTEVVKLLKEAMKEKVLEVTMADLEKKYNCKVKVVK